MAAHNGAPKEKGSAQPPEPPEPQGGPLERERQFIEERTRPLRPRGPEEPSTQTPTTPTRESDDERPRRGPKPRISDEDPHAGPESDLTDLAERANAAMPSRRDAVREYRAKQVVQTDAPVPFRRARAAAVGEDELPEPPAGPPANNWIPLGPSVLREGQGGVQPACSGRTPGIAVAAGGLRVYVAAANGGVWRSDDAGVNWRSLMDAFDLNPTAAASDSLSCGAIAIDPTNPNQIFVGSGEGTGAAFFGVGPVVSADGGTSWATELATAGSLSLEGTGFYALAVDPATPTRVVAATRRGVYRREPAGTAFTWTRKVLGTGSQVMTSVVVAFAGGVTTFYAAKQGGLVFSSTDGHTWTQIGTGFPTASVGRVGLAVDSDDPTVVYALIAASDGSMLGVWRLDTGTGNWLQVGNHPTDLFGPPGFFQGWYDLAIAVDPNNTNRIYLGGSTKVSGGEWSGCAYRCDITSTGTSATLAYTMTSTFIGGSVHADIHTLGFAPGDSNKLWLGCDGGVFYSTNPTGSGNIFEQRNTGLATVTVNNLDQHPTQDAVLFSGTQDNGGIRFTGEEAWLHSAPGDGGFYVVNWNDPYRVLSTYVRGVIRRFTNGGVRYTYGGADVPLPMGEPVLFYAPLVGTPPNQATPTEAELIAFGSIRPWISTNFGTSWQSIPSNARPADDLNGAIRSLVFASATRLYAGTVAGGVYRFDLAAGVWTRTQINTLGGANSLPLAGAVTDIVVDPADATGSSVYISFGGTGDYRHVWHFNGTQWQQSSGPASGAATSILDVQVSALATDPANPQHLYAGADLGVWRSTDGGQTWAVFSEGLPDAAVLDLKFHPVRRLLRAATHGRGVFERTLDTAPKAGIELYVRDTQLDQGRFGTTNGLPDPTKQGDTVRHYRGPDIKLDTPSASGQYQFPISGTIDFFQFVETLSDDFQNVATHATATITTRVYVQVHNRGVTPANNVRVMCLLANCSAGLPALPAGFNVNVASGTAIQTANWTTLGFAILNNLRVGFPQIASFDLTSDKLPPPANLAGNQHHCVLALLHHPSDPFTNAQTNTDLLSLGERKSAHKNLTVVQFTGTLPPVAPVVVPIRINNPYRKRARIGLRISLRKYPGRVRIAIPPLKVGGKLEDVIKGAYVVRDPDDFTRWAKDHMAFVKTNQQTKHPYRAVWVEQRLRDVEAAMTTGLTVVAKDENEVVIGATELEPDAYTTVFLMLDRPPKVAPGRYYELNVTQFEEGRETRAGGLDVRIELVPAPRRPSVRRQAVDRAEGQPGDGQRVTA